MFDFLMPDNPGDFWTSIGAIATFLAVGVALWPAFSSWRRRPKLDTNIRLHPPECGIYLQNEITRVSFVNEPGMQAQTVQSVSVGDAFWFRLYVTNTGKTAAHDVEVTIGDLMRLEDRRLVPYAGFLLSNLIWTHGAEVSRAQLLPGTERNVDLGNMRRPERSTQAQFRFQLSIEPVSPYNVVEAGTYQFTIQAGAANCDPVRTQFRLAFDGGWNVDPAVMFERHVSITRLD
jgi:hypothetical protein